ncbi:MAG TPA: sulfite exporter TauE/SafE family protein [Pseudolabrys sp.]|nr:sulfite exporter TauE/SafE family protein [Pseudolabrys sp.]
MTALLIHQLASLLAGQATLVVTLVSIFAGALASGLAGFAFSAIAGALLFHWLPPIEAVPLLLACSITTQLLSISSLWRTMQWRQCATYLVGGLVGIPVGAKLLEGINSHAFAAGFGVFLICYSAYMLLRPSLSLRGGGRLAEVAAGFAGGITGGATAFPGAFPTMWCNVRGLSKTEQRGIVQPFILCMQIATLIYFSKLGILASATLSVYLWCAPVVIAGTCLGLHFFNRVDDKKFRRLVLLFLMISGATLVL